jgi:hypothetical protein
MSRTSRRCRSSRRTWSKLRPSAGCSAPGKRQARTQTGSVPTSTHQAILRLGSGAARNYATSHNFRFSKCFQLLKRNKQSRLLASSSVSPTSTSRKLSNTSARCSVGSPARRGPKRNARSQRQALPCGVGRYSRGPPAAVQTASATVRFHWDGRGAPSVAALPGQPLPPSYLVDALYQRAVLHSDYDAIGAAERCFLAALREGETRVTTPLGTDLRFRVGDRPANIPDGDAFCNSRAQGRGARGSRSRVALWRSANRAARGDRPGEVIAFPPSQWDGRPVTGLRPISRL